MTISLTPNRASLLRRYFYSGWAFLIPYLAVYLLYYVTKWPVNPTSESSTSHTPLCLSHLQAPCLLHLYWALHLLHLLLAGLAMWSWLTDRKDAALPRSSYSSYCLHLLIGIAPWAILALIFYIPSFYLEWPSDPWEHLRRINEWRLLDTVGAHSYWPKSTYFIAYSMLNWSIGLRQLFWLDFYYTGICLLLCWQYYRLSLTCGMGKRASMIFVITQALFFGNNIFSFYRYYGISSSIYAQLGAIALIRIAIEWVAIGGTYLSQNASGSSILDPHPSRLPILKHLSLQPSFWHLPTLLRVGTCASILFLFTAYNHPQGVGIAFSGIAAVLFWRLFTWSPPAGWGGLGMLLVVNFLVVWSQPEGGVLAQYQVQGYLNEWYGFNIFHTSSPAFNRVLQIVGWLGILTLLSAILLLRNNHVVAWLTVFPILMVTLPCFGILFTKNIPSPAGEQGIITFHRLLFAIPVPLAFSTLLLSAKNYINRFDFFGIDKEDNQSPFKRRVRYLPRFTFVLACITLSANLILPPEKPFYHRFWHALQVSPKESCGESILMDALPLASASIINTTVITNFAVGSILKSSGIQDTPYAWRAPGGRPTEAAAASLSVLRNASGVEILYTPCVQNSVTPKSIAGTLSTHWQAQNLSCDYQGIAELQAEAIKLGWTPVHDQTSGIIWHRPRKE